jgi:putative holliday junction resolvase
VPGVWVGVDVGTVRVGVARSDPSAILATPVATLARDLVGNRDITDIAALAVEWNAVGVVIGLPRTLRNREGPSADLAREYGTLLAEQISPLPVEFVDERLTTVTAQRKLRQSGVRGSKATRAVVDQVAATELLQHWLDTRRNAH